jgi:dihydroorotate dehydrogenase
MAAPSHLPRYDIHRTYRWNYDHAPDPVSVDVPPVNGDYTFCGRRVSSPLGIPAGPLLNGRWVLYYAALGFDVLTYKTVRSAARECYALPNLQPVTTENLAGGEPEVSTTADMNGSWAVSFGMPSMTPDEWRADVEWTRKTLAPEKILVVSVVGSVQPDWTIDDLANDYAKCAGWAVDSGADCIETNFSCPNVSTCDGQLFQQPEQAAMIAQRVRDEIGAIPYFAKIGHMTDPDAASQLLDSLAPYVDALAMTNSVATKIRQPNGALLFDGQPRGICGEATRSASVAQTRLFANLIADKQMPMGLIGVGGASTADHVREYLDAGAEGVHLATSVMVDPTVGLRIRAAL